MGKKPNDEETDTYKKPQIVEWAYNHHTGQEDKRLEQSF